MFIFYNASFGLKIFRISRDQFKETVKYNNALVALIDDAN